MVTGQIPAQQKPTWRERRRAAKIYAKGKWFQFRLWLTNHRNLRITAFQFACFIAGLVGIALLPVGAWAVPAAIIIGAIIGITAAERQ